MGSRVSGELYERGHSVKLYIWRFKDGRFAIGANNEREARGALFEYFASFLTLELGSSLAETVLNNWKLEVYEMPKQPGLSVEVTYLEKKSDIGFTLA